jgi:alkanesulfonate monooxygenase SsuD/methylene tetrahydromethanopterin reductase-like flavin-dependent oxidoreductase (luciferase family)
MTLVSHDRQLGAALRYPFSWRDVVAVATEAESLGYDGLFLPESVGRDALVTLGALATQTSRLRLGTGILAMGTRTPGSTAMGAATVQELSGGRLVLGLGTGSPGPGALTRLREMVDVVRRLLSGETVETSGRRVRLWLVPATPPPIWISALGPNAVRTAGEIADGVLLNWCTPERVRRARIEIATGATAAGRDPAEVTVGVYVRCCIGDDERSVGDALRTATGEYASIPAYARQLATLGLGVEAEAAAAAHAAGRPDDVPAALVEAVCVSGDPSAARGALEAYGEAGADLPIVYPVAAGDDPVASVLGTLGALAPA